MRSSWGTLVVVLAVFAVGSGCVADGDGASPASTEPPGQPVAGADTEQDHTSVNQLPDGYDVVGATPVAASEEGGRTALRRVAAVGSTDADPRVIEYTLYRFDDAASARQAAAAAPNAVSVIDPVVLDGGGLVGFVEPVDGLRALLGLAPHGPGFDAVFQVLVGPTVVAVGGSAVLQPPALAPMLESLSTEPETYAQRLPDGMVVLVDEEPLEGTTFELTSTNGTTTVEVYLGASRSWFDYVTWGRASAATEGELLDLGVEVRVRPPQSYGLEGAVTDPEQTMVWGAERLMIVTHRHTTPSAELAGLVDFFLELDRGEVLALMNSLPADGSDDDGERVGGQPPPGPGTTSDAPTIDDMARLQAFVETARGIQAPQPIVFEFVDDFPTSEASGAQFLSRDLWLVAEALGLTDDGQTVEGANQARIDRIKGTPGVVELQATRTFTDVVVVHEMVHVIDPAPQTAAEPELVSLGQAVVEGNAHRIAFDYVTSLPQVEQVEVPDFPAIFGPDGDERLSTAVQDLLEFPYDEGRIFMAEIADRGGEAMIESVLRRVPVSTEQLLYVDAWEADDAPVNVERPTAPDRAEPLAGGTLGVYLLFLTAREAGLGQEALEVLDQWAGDSFVSYEDDGQICVVAQVVMDTSQAAAQLEDLLDNAGSLRSSVVADSVTAEFCS